MERAGSDLKLLMDVMHNNSLEEARTETKVLLSKGSLQQRSTGHRLLHFILPSPTAGILTAQEAKQAVGPASPCFRAGCWSPFVGSHGLEELTGDNHQCDSTLWHRGTN